jgi:hypothetical protein
MRMASAAEGIRDRGERPAESPENWLGSIMEGLSG